ncbi:MAG: hypothetical protein J0L63_09430 [Anaerolineae bacterium]|nr:hypothetical protein [Anaerolineae bacterium]
MRRSFAIPLLAALVALSGCTGQRGQTLEDIPTPASIDALATAQVLTAVAPPEGFRDPINIPEVDANLQLLVGGHYRVHLEFEGVFSRTPRQTSAQADAEVWFNQAGGQRRVVVQTAGELLGREDNAFEAVRLNGDSYLVQNSECLTQGVDATTAAGLRAGTLVGGITRGIPAGQRATVNSQDVYRYDFSTADLNLPSIRLADGGTVEATSGELWLSAEHNVVVRFYVNLNVTNAIIFDRALPVDGQVILRYDLDSINQTTNITIPNGC